VHQSRIAGLAGDASNHREAARLFATAEAVRRRTGAVRFKICDTDYTASVEALRDDLGENEFESVWAGGLIVLWTFVNERRLTPVARTPSTTATDAAIAGPPSQFVPASLRWSAGRTRVVGGVP